MFRRPLPSFGLYLLLEMFSLDALQLNLAAFDEWTTTKANVGKARIMARAKAEVTTETKKHEINCYCLSSFHPAGFRYYICWMETFIGNEQISGGCKTSVGLVFYKNHSLS
jgi:hypothetical protein